MSHDNHDPLTRRAGTRTDDGPSLFDLLPPPSPGTTQQLAAAQAAETRRQRYQQIEGLIRQRGPMTLFELSAALKVSPNQISGRITELLDTRRLEKTGERRKNPATGSTANVYRLGQEQP